MLPIKNRFGLLVIYVVLSIFAAYSVLPFFWSMLQSVKTVRQANAPTPLIFFEPTFQNYGELWLDEVPQRLGLLALALVGVIAGLILLAIFAQRLPIPKPMIWLALCAAFFGLLLAIPRVVDTTEFYDFFFNTAVVTIGTVLVSVTIGCLSGYALARFTEIDGVVLLIAALTFRALPGLAFALPYFTLAQYTGLNDTYFLLILVLVAADQPFTIWMLRGFFSEIPRELEEAAMVDGASFGMLFRKIIMPLMWPGIISTALFTVLLVYHEFLLVLVLNQSQWTMSVAISQFAGTQYSTRSTLPFAASVSATLLIMVVVLVFQKQLVKGITAGAVKG
jgi:multiple sugar transport system permease protein